MTKANADLAHGVLQAAAISVVTANAPPHCAEDVAVISDAPAIAADSTAATASTCAQVEPHAPSLDDVIDASHRPPED